MLISRPPIDRLAAILGILTVAALAATQPAVVADAGRTRGIVVPARGIGKEYPVEALLAFVAKANVGTVIIDWDCVPQTWSVTDGASVAQFATRLAASGVKVAAMYRPRFTDTPTVPTQVKANGAPVELDACEICYANSQSRRWGVSWIPFLLQLSPAITEVIIAEPRDVCHCRLCGERPKEAAYVPSAGLLQFLTEAREAVKRARPEANLGLAGGMAIAYWQTALPAIDVAHPVMTMQERMEAGRFVPIAKALAPTLGPKMGECLYKLDADYGLAVTPAYVGQCDREAIGANVAAVLWPFNTAFLSDDYDAPAVCEAMGLKWPEVGPILEQMAGDAQADDGPPLVEVPEDRPDITPEAGKYAVVTGVPTTDPYYQAAQALADYRHVPVVTIPFHPAQALYKALQSLRAEQIAIVAPPSEIVPDVVDAVFLAAVTMDHDVELDFTYGFITGDTADDALRMVQHTIEAETHRPQPMKALCIGHVFDGMDHCYKGMQQRAADYRQMGMQAETIRYDNDDKQWPDEKNGEMAKFDNANVIVFCGHGSGQWAAGIRGPDLFRVQVNHAIVFDGTCYSNAAREAWFEQGPAQRLKLIRIPSQASVALGLIHAGAIGLVGSICGNGFMLVSEPMYEVDRGLSLGAAFRSGQDLNIHRARLKNVTVYPYREGEQCPANRGTRAHRQASIIAPVTLYGDPAYVPFPGGLPHARPRSPVADGSAVAVPDELKLVAGRNEFVMQGNNGASTMIIQYLADRSFSAMQYAAVCDNKGVRALMRFDLSRVSLLTGMKVKKATLRVFAGKPVSMPTPGMRPLALHLVTSPWGATASWTTAPEFDSTPTAPVLFEKAEKWLEFDVTPLVQGWLTDPARNYGVMLKFVTEGQQPAVSWNLAGRLAEDASTRPRLVFECE